MQNDRTTPITTPNGGRLPFGDLFEAAMRRLPTPTDNSQKEDFLKGKPSVFGTLDRVATATLRAGATQEQYDEWCNALHLALLAKWDHRADVPRETLPEACALDEAAEGVEDVAEIDAVANPTVGRLHALWHRMNASMTAKRRALRVIHRDLNKALAR